MSAEHPAAHAGSEQVGPSSDYRALLRGEIASEEYVERLKARVDERFESERRFKGVQPWWKKLLRRG